MISRKLEESLRLALKQFPAVVVTGARQSGKTTLARAVMPEANYITFDIPSEAAFAASDPAHFLSKYIEPLILDEFQYVPELTRHLKVLIDSDRRPGRFLLTGSQNFSSLGSVSESLAGRCAVLTLPMLSCNELNIRGQNELDRYLWRGGFPELWQRPELDRSLWLSSYLATYLERDVRTLGNIGSLRDFDRFLRAVALRAGQLCVFSELARDVGISVGTARSWISILEASQQIFLLEPYHLNRGKRLIKTPKIYFQETGMLVFLLGFQSWPDVISSHYWGSVWENAVVAEARKMRCQQADPRPLWFWRTAAGDEIDLLMEVGPEEFIAVEAKAAVMPTHQHAAAFSKFTALHGEQSLRKKLICCRCSESRSLSANSDVALTPLWNLETNSESFSL
jgi:predicted AAA+ superfamily ATPase